MDIPKNTPLPPHVASSFPCARADDGAPWSSADGQADRTPWDISEEACEAQNPLAKGEVNVAPSGDPPSASTTSSEDKLIGTSMNVYPCFMSGVVLEIWGLVELVMYYCLATGVVSVSS